ncbi:MAG: 4Fe-4S dicluster domain-containing protein [Chloroflexota bacterium]
MKLNIPFEKTDEFRSAQLESPELGAPGSPSRRRFMALMAASTAFATACTDYRDKGEINSYNKKPEGAEFGVPRFFASCSEDGSAVIVKAREGRPIKIEGNPEHPVARGKATLQTQAAPLDLYNPQRLRNARRGDKEISIKHAMDEALAKLRDASASGREIAIISHTVNSYTLGRILDEFSAKYPTTRVYSYELFDDLNRTDAWRNFYGNENLPVIDWARPDTILLLEADIFGTEGDRLAQIGGCAERKNSDDPAAFQKIYSVESRMTLTGSVADMRARVKPSMMQETLRALLADVAKKMGKPIPVFAEGATIQGLQGLSEANRKKLEKMSRDLVASAGKSLVYAGESQGYEVHALALALNNMLGGEANFKTDSSYIKNRKITTPDEWRRFSGDLYAGRIGMIINLDANPAFHLPRGYGLEGGWKKAGYSISISVCENETSALSSLTIPASHWLESWGDYRNSTNLITFRQPIINPLYGTPQKEATLLALARGVAEIKDEAFRAYFREGIAALPGLDFGGEFDIFWNAALETGFAALPAVPQTFAFNPAAADNLAPARMGKGYEVVFAPAYSILDGRYADNGWLMELPHPISKVVWENYAAMSEATARQLGVEYKDNKSDIVEIKLNGATLRLPVVSEPGTADGAIVVELGWGRKIAGEVGREVGVDAIPALSRSGDISRKIYSGATVTKTGDRVELASTQEQHKMTEDDVRELHRDRKIIIDGSIADYKKNPGFVSEHREEPASIYDEVKYSEVKWAMAIDLNKCFACGTCVVACAVENNTPVVGKEECLKGREMQWMRIDRYWSGTDDNPVPSHQPMLCQHCDLAPCENVCPVLATTHSTDGLNQMTYNRCVGTRYCSNNCPYKVRRFNFFDYRERFRDGLYKSDSLELMQNPEVTVRARGVMEKCTFCIQRIMEARQQATADGEDFRVAKSKNEVQTACQQACPANAIVFGDVNDPASEISRIVKHKLGYKVLEYLCTRPNVTYIAKLRNNEMEDIS